MATAKQPVSIDGIEFDALMDSKESLDAEVPSYPTETGFEVSDSIILKPLTLNMTLFLSNTPVTWKSRHGSSPSRVQDVLKHLEELYFKKTPVTISTSDKTYSNMAITSITLTKTKEHGADREVPISFQQVLVTESKTTTIPDSYGKSGTTGQNAGTASTTSRATSGSGRTTAPQKRSSGESGSNGSILYNLASRVGLLG